jgi:hypothetical protein
VQNRVKRHSVQVTEMKDWGMPMRYEMKTRETQSEKATRLIGEIGFVVVFCLSDFTLTMFALVHMHMSKLLR